MRMNKFIYKKIKINLMTKTNNLSFLFTVTLSMPLLIFIYLSLNGKQNVTSSATGYHIILSNWHTHSAST